MLEPAVKLGRRTPRDLPQKAARAAMTLNSSDWGAANKIESWDRCGGAELGILNLGMSAAWWPLQAAGMKCRQA